MVLPPAPPSSSPAPGAWRHTGPPTPPAGRARLSPRKPPLPPTPSPASSAPAGSGGRGVGAGPARPSNFLQVHHHASRPFDSQLRAGKAMPARPLPPGYIRSQRSRPRPAPEGRGRGGSRLGGQRRSGHALGARGRTDCGWVAARTVLLPSPAGIPHPPTCLRDPRDRGQGAWVGGPGPSSRPSPPGPAHLAMKVNLSAACAPRLRQLVPSSGAWPASCARHLLPAAQAPRHQGGPPCPPFPPPSAPRPLPASRPGRRLRCHRAPRPAPGLRLSLRAHFPPLPAEGSTRPASQQLDRGVHWEA